MNIPISSLSTTFVSLKFSRSCSRIWKFQIIRISTKLILIRKENPHLWALCIHSPWPLSAWWVWNPQAAREQRGWIRQEFAQSLHFYPSNRIKLKKAKRRKFKCSVRFLLLSLFTATALLRHFQISRFYSPYSLTEFLSFFILNSFRMDAFAYLRHGDLPFMQFDGLKLRNYFPREIEKLSVVQVTQTKTFDEVRIFFIF